MTEDGICTLIMVLSRNPRKEILYAHQISIQKQIEHARFLLIFAE